MNRPRAYLIAIALVAVRLLSLPSNGAEQSTDPTASSTTSPLPATTLAGTTAHPSPSSGDGPPPLPVVLGVRREPEVDRWVSSSGRLHTGWVLNESFRLQTAHGELRFPAHMLAAIDLTRQREGVDSVITATGDRLSGILLESEFQLRPAGSSAAGQTRRELIDKILFRLLPAGGIQPAPTSLVVLRNGDFVSGSIQPEQWLIRPSAGEPRNIGIGSVASLEFPELARGLVRVEPLIGESWEGTIQPLDVRVELAIGLSMTIYADRLASIRPWTGLPYHLAGRIGVPTAASDRPTGPSDVIPPGLVWIPPGEFDLGSPNEERDRDLDEGPVTRVLIPDGFWMAAHEVTQADYESLIGRNPSQYTGDGRHPVEKVNWQQAIDFCRALNTREQTLGRLPDGYTFRLPTEAEWEYACRAGTTTRFSHGDDPGYLETPNFAWCGHNSGSATHPVGTRQPNPWGLFDMHGNVWEWCLNPWTGAYPGGTITNTIAVPQGSLRVARGGSWLYDPHFCRSANRDSYGMLNRCSDVGFRVVLAPIR